jgi:hypothetical protein
VQANKFASRKNDGAGEGHRLVTTPSRPTNHKEKTPPVRPHPRGLPQRLDLPGQGGTAEQVRDSLINAELVARGSVVLDAAPDDVPFTGAPDAAERIAAVAPKSARAAVAWWHALINADRALAPADAYQLAAALSRADEVRDA